jgi:hypothetical protein
MKSPLDESFTKFAAETAFHQFVTRYVLHARDLARSGQKDGARDWYRFFTNAQVVKLLGCSGSFEVASLKSLAADIGKLGVECHPDDVPDWATDIQAIRYGLEQILMRLPAAKRTLLVKSRSFSVRQAKSRFKL